MSMKCLYRTIQLSLWRTILSFALLLCTLNFINIAQAKHMVVFGDSLSAAYGMHLEQGWVQLVARDLGNEHKVSNASISGETTAGGLARLPLTLQELRPDVVMLELGANDGLRGYPISDMKANLTAMIKLIQASGAKVVLVGISIPPSYGARYIDQFRDLYQQLAAEYQLPFIDFYIEDFFTTPGYLQQDGLHPTVSGQPIIRDSVIRFLDDQQVLK